ncbi:MAG: endo-1,4-beta-xylanase [Acidobacteria bacterium]|nr:endo-1,4-beta-xylanase [Acidobacteriota bacterium]
MRYLSLLSLTFAAVAPLAAQTSILPADTLGAFRLACTSGGKLERVPAEGSMGEALRITTPPTISTGTDREWSCRIRHTLAVPVANGDWLVAAFWVRSVATAESGEAYVKLNFERNTSDYRKSVNAGTLVTPYWRRIQIPFKMVEAYTPGGAMLDFWVGYDPQTIEIGGIAIDNYGQSANPPVATEGYTYPGREADAPWRAAAQERIGQHRKADLKLVVTNAQGQPQEGVPVKVRMKRHAFGFGSAVAADSLLGTRADDEIYRQKVKELFNKVVFENDLKWPGWEQNRNRALNAVRWLRENGITDIRGHNMVWPNWQYLPNDVRALASNPDALRKRIDDHITDVGTATAGLVKDWDVINEPIPNRDLKNILGDQELVRWLRLARAADPDVRLFINEYDLETGGGRNVRKQDQFLQLLQAMLDAGAPLTGIGIQGHFGTDVTHPQKVYDVLDRFAALGLPLQITEFDINTLDEQLQADYLRDYLTIVFSHPAIDAFLQWGFWEGRHWLPAAALYRRDWSEKPHGKAYRELVFNQWWTNADGVTGTDGTFTVRGFLGDYEIETPAGVMPVKLQRDAAPVAIILP